MTSYATVIIPVPLKQYFTYSFDSKTQNVTEGVRVKVPFGKRQVIGFVVETTSSHPEVTYEIKPISSIVDKQPLFGRNETDLALWMEKFYLCSRGEAIGTMIPSGKRDSSIPTLESDYEEAEQITPTSEQQAAIDEILSGRHRSIYLFGITGSGKTEIFLRTAESVIAKGKQVIYLVPEITLTHQLARIVARRFEGKVAILHSAMTPAQRIKEWRRIKHGDVSLVIGARSAVFAPCDDLGLIIIDEEHENSYKSGSSPRYHARQIAQRRASVSDAMLLMGSATPSLESYQMAKNPDKLYMIRLRNRVSGGHLPSIQVVNILGQRGILSPVLKQQMDSTINDGRQVILFMNRRGYNYSFHCNSCGFVLQCPHCAVNLTYHKSDHAFVCHYCGYHSPLVSACPECHSLDVSYSGFGTEKVEQEVKQTFPDARTVRLDTDIAKERDAISTIIDGFRLGEYDILLGTQMVAKGLNFPNLSLVGIVLADSTLNIPDFRSAERTFSLIVQVSGRSGRYDDKGKVIIQTTKPDSPAISYAVSGKIDEFYEQELETRKLTAFPPFTRLVQLVFRGKNEEKVRQTASFVGEVFAQSIKKYRKPDELLEMLGPSECPIAKVAQNFRHQILIRGENPSRVHTLISRVVQTLNPVSGIYLEIDFDPLALL